MGRIESAIVQSHLQCKQILQAMEAELLEIPKGSLVCRTLRGKQYYHLQFRDAQGKVHNQRIEEADIEKTQKLLGRRKVLKQDISQLQRYMKITEKAFPLLHSCVTENLIAPGSAPDPDRPYLTLKGEYVRSKSELIIANELYVNQIPYEYEKPLYLKGRSYPVHPDFTIYTPQQNLTVYWEHCGLMGNEEYRAKWEHKRQAYERSKISEWNKNLIVTYEYKGNDLDLYDIRRHIALLKQL